LAREIKRTTRSVTTSGAQAAVELPCPSRPAASRSKPGNDLEKTDATSGEFIVYPAHGVGQIVAIEKQEVAGSTLELFVINFVKMTLRVPTAKISAVGMRKLAEKPIVRRARETLKGRARINSRTI
jgi:CarD family transcriptional regulator